MAEGPRAAGRQRVGGAGGAQAGLLPPLARVVAAVRAGLGIALSLLHGLHPREVDKGKGEDI